MKYLKKIIIDTASVNKSLVVGESQTSSKTIPVLTLAPVNVDSYDVTNAKSTKYLMKVMHGPDIQTSEIVIVTNSGYVGHTEYAVQCSNSVLGSFDVTQLSNAVSITFTPAVLTSSMTVTFFKISI